MAYKPLDLLIEAEEEARKYLLPISTKEWAEITGENLRNYSIVSIDALIDDEEESHFHTSDDDITDRQIVRYHEARLGMNSKERDKLNLDDDIEEYQVLHSMMKYIMIAKGKKEGARVIVDFKVREIEERPYMTGIGLVPLTDSKEDDKEEGHYKSITDTLKGMHKKLSDKK